MSGRQIRRKPIAVTAVKARELAMGIMALLPEHPEKDAIDWPDLPILPGEDTYLGKIVIGGWPLVDGQLTDYRPRQGRKLQDWKFADRCAELMEVSGSSAMRLLDPLGEEHERVDGDEDMGVLDQLAKLSMIDELVNEIQDYSQRCDDAAATIRAIQWPLKRPPTR